MRADFEIQVHSGSGRGRVRRLRVNRALLTVASAAVLLYLLLLAAAVGLAPGVVGAWLGSEEYRGLAAERTRQGERLQALVARLEELRAHGDTALEQVRKVTLAYEIRPAAGAAAGAGPAAGAAGAAQRGGGSHRPAAADGAAAETLPRDFIYSGAAQQGDRLRQRIRGQLDALEAALAQVRDFESAHPDVVRDTPAACPLRGDRYVLINPFGRQRSAFTRELGFHAGIDLAAPRGTPILAPADGVVVFAGIYPLRRSAAWWRFGNLVAVAHGERFLTFYGHCGDLAVAPGRRVRRGERLATVGSTGWSFSPQLYYEIRKRMPGGGEAVPVDPLVYILDRRWPGEERLLVRGRPDPPVRGYEPLPPGLDRPGEGQQRRRPRG